MNVIISDQNSSPQLHKVVILFGVIAILIGIGFLLESGKSNKPASVDNLRGFDNTVSSSTISSKISNNNNLELSKEPYVDKERNFLISIPKGWKISVVNNKTTVVYGIYDPTLGHLSQIVLSVVPSIVEINYLDQKVQENAVKLLDSGIQKGSEEQDATIALVSNKRVSSTTIDLVYSMTFDGNIIEMPARIVFAQNTMGFIFARLSPDDKDISPLKNVILDSIRSFKILPSTSAPVRPTTQKMLNGAYQNISETTQYESKRFNFSIQYPAHWDWETAISNNPESQNEYINFALRSNFLKGPSKLAIINFSGDDIGQYTTLENEINRIINGNPKNVYVNRNLQIIPSTWPSDVTAEAFEIETYLQMVDGTQFHRKYFWVVAKRGNTIYEYQMATDPEDYDTIYPLALSILKSITFK